MIKAKYYLKEIAVVKNGSTPSTDREEFYDGDISWITPKDLSDSKKKYISKGHRNITLEGFNSCSTTLLPPGSILLSSRAPIGLLAIVNDTLCTNQGFKNLVLNENKIDNEYLYYWLKTQVGYINSLGTGTTFKEVSKSVIEDLVIELPLSTNTQSQIAKVLSDLDAKIELNNKINAELEAMAKLIYDYWFVQFEFPFDFAQDKPKADIRPYKSSGGKMVWNEELKREIPEGWEVKTIENFIEVKDGTHDSPKPKEEGYPLITSKNLKPSGLDFKEANLISIEDYESINKRSQVDTGDILFSMIGNIGTIYKVEEKKIEFAVKNVAIFKTSKNIAIKNFLYMFLKSIDMERYMKNVISGSIQKFIGLGSLRNCPLFYNESILEVFSFKIEGIFKLLENNKLENQKLSELRDWLLPMLMNGQVRVN